MNNFYRFCVAVFCLIVAHASGKVEDAGLLDYEPQIAISCEKVAKHIDVKTGVWTDDLLKEKFCSTEPSAILKFCQSTYPNIDVTNIVEANENVTICSGKDCQSSYSVVPYRCLVGKFEADALSYPFDAKCDFGYVHESKTCKNHAYWNERAKQICSGKQKYLEKYGILVPCGTDVFTGVEYVCCKEKGAANIAEDKKPEREEQKSDHEILNDLLNTFASHIPKKSKGCDRSIYNTKTDLVRQEKNEKVKDVAKNLNEAKARMEELKKDDPDQAQALFKKTLQIFQGTLKNIENQAKLDMSRLNQEKKECAQMSLNHKKHLAMSAFVDAVRQHVDKPDKIIKTFQRFMRVLENDQNQNMRELSKKLNGKGSKKIMSIRDLFLKHLKVVKTSLNEGVDILRKVASVQGKIKFDLPTFARDIDFEFAHEPKTTPAPPTTAAPASEKPSQSKKNKMQSDAEGEHDSTHATDDMPRKSKPAKPKPLKEKDDDGKHHHRDHPLKSRAVFAAVIGLSCGALVIMIVIVLALFFRKGSSKRNTKTVIADDDCQEKRHLMKMQEDGFENPTYKFFAN
ncbi:amyloid-beta A4 protein-like [Dendronephthya gigantea]|uniref:amyloid-beta A4 protein-like n=1 Tax=Dendronephthya gigantea TaxID=151771 RepID=UPI00106C086B|nr:amyloid-beta A4 protein-like [Dendronephthya gigantea]